MRDLRILGEKLLTNPRALSAIEEAEALWGRNTIFVEYSKLLVIANRSRGADDVAFIVEYLVADMKRNTKCSSNPDVPSRVSLMGKPGDVAAAQLVRHVEGQRN